MIFTEEILYGKLHFLSSEIYLLTILSWFNEKTECCNFADDDILYKSSPNLSLVLNSLEHDLLIVLNWFKVNLLKANPNKFQFMVLGERKVSYIDAKLKAVISSKDKVVLLEITICNKIRSSYNKNFCKKASYKLHALFTKYKNISHSNTG